MTGKLASILALIGLATILLSASLAAGATERGSSTGTADPLTSGGEAADRY